MRKNINKLATLVMTGALAASMSFAAFAEGETQTQTPTITVSKKNEDAVTEGGLLTIKKYVTTDGQTMAPNTTFTLNVTGGAITGNYKDPNGKTYYGITSGANLLPSTTTATATFSPTGAKDANGNAVNLSDKYMGEFKIDFSGVNYPNAGVYSYQVTEVNGGYDGIKYDTAAKDVLVFVVNENNSRVVKNIILLNSDRNAKIDSITNDYGADSDNDSTHDLTISKAVTGTGANLSEKFTFEIKVTGEAGEMYKVYLVEGDGETETLTEKTVLTSNTEAEFKDIQNGTKLRIYGLDNNDTVSVRELQAGLNGYSTSYVVENNGTDGNKSETTLANAEAAATANAKVDHATLTITNDKEYVTPTGVAMDIAPYALMVALAGGAAATFLRKKESFED